MKVIRLIIYDGDSDWVLKTISDSIQGTRTISTGGSITAITLGTLPDSLELMIADMTNRKEE
uniref:Uncharacterized protein n=1 Tax=viral metagenome TaxID=1070528 RepID=A0A6H1ZFX8_9ZZZZ